MGQGVAGYALSTGAAMLVANLHISVDEWAQRWYNEENMNSASRLSILGHSPKTQCNDQTKCDAGIMA